MHADVERALAGDANFLRDVSVPVREGGGYSCGLHQKLDVEAKWVFSVCSLV